jgi:hypothetical protein
VRPLHAVIDSRLSSGSWSRGHRSAIEVLHRESIELVTGGQSQEGFFEFSFLEGLQYTREDGGGIGV